LLQNNEKSVTIRGDFRFSTIFSRIFPKFDKKTQNVTIRGYACICTVYIKCQWRQCKSLIVVSALNI